MAVAAALVALFLIAAAAFAALRPSSPVSAEVPTSADIEAKWGVRPIMVAATADGGLVDFRFIALDPEKVAALMIDVKNLPVLVAEDTGTLINSTAAMAGDKHTFNAGGTYFMLYRNTNGAIRPGTPVTIAFGDLKIQHVIAR
jgi:hypothetical protein